MNSLFTRFFCFFMALQLLNCSVDAPDAKASWSKEDLKYNEQESLLEILVEKVLGFGNVIGEYDDDDSCDETSAKKTFSVDYFLLPSHSDESLAAYCIPNKPTLLYTTICPQFCCGSFSPPPEV